jgi:hypothetical protein
MIYKEKEYYIMNENNNAQKCPCCPRRCNLSEPSCGRGEEYSKTGKMPEHNGHDYGHSSRLQFEKKEQQLVMKYLHHAVGAADRGGFTQDMTGEMFSVLTDEETAQLANLLEKLSDHWMQTAPEKPHHHGRPHDGEHHEDR